MKAQDTITKIIAAKTLLDVLDVKNLKHEYREISKIIHPDVCNLPKANVAFSKLNELIDLFNEGKEYQDDAGKFTTNQYWVKFTGNKKLLDISYANYRSLMSLKTDAAKNFQKYLPNNMYFSGDSLVCEFNKRSVPVCELSVDQVHANWIVSRILELSAWLCENSFVHCGFNPESVFIVPENHGIQVVSFYHMSKIGSRLKTVSAKYKHWYSETVFTQKKAMSFIDIELAKRTGAYVLGDKSGSGVLLKRNKNVNQDYLNFILSHEIDTHKVYFKYRDMLSKNFEKKFHSINV